MSNSDAGGRDTSFVGSAEFFYRCLSSGNFRVRTDDGCRERDRTCCRQFRFVFALGRHRATAYLAKPAVFSRGRMVSRTGPGHHVQSGHRGPCDAVLQSIEVNP